MFLHDSLISKLLNPNRSLALWWWQFIFLSRFFDALKEQWGSIVTEKRWNRWQKESLLVHNSLMTDLGLMSSIVFSVLIHVETQVLAEDLEFRQNSRRLEAKFYLNSASKLCVGKWRYFSIFLESGKVIMLTLLIIWIDSSFEHPFWSYWLRLNV